MPKHLPALSALVVLPLHFANAQRLSLPFPPPSSPIHQKAPVIKKLPMPMTAPLFLESGSYTSTLYLVNQLKFGVQADVSVYDMSGALLLTGHRYLEANSSQTISIHKLLGDAGLYAEAGSVEIVSPENSNALLGQLSVTRTDGSKEYLDEELFMPQQAASRELRTCGSSFTTFIRIRPSQSTSEI